MSKSQKNGNVAGQATVSQVDAGKNVQSANNVNVTAVGNGNDRQAKLARLKASLEKTKQVKLEQSTGFIKIKAGEIRGFDFTGDVEAVEKTFKRKEKDATTGVEKEIETRKWMYSYKVIDRDNPDAGVQTLELSRQWSDIVDNLLRKGFLSLELKREGSTMGDTNYLISPIVEDSSS